MKQIIVLLLSTAMGVIMMSCKESATNPPEEKPPGYQEDIPWPSLADSPWPMNHHDPQSTGRSKFRGPSIGQIEWEIDSIYMKSGISIGADGAIYFIAVGAGGLYAINKDGSVKWISKNIITNTDAATTPLIANDGTIYVGDGLSGNLCAVNSDGSLKWKLNIGSLLVHVGLNIGKDGIIYLLSGSTISVPKLIAVNPSGSIAWIYENEKIDYGTSAGISLSADGNTIFLPGIGPSVIALDANLHKLKWDFGQSRYQATPVVDNEGNVYLLSSVDSINSGNTSIFCLNQNGKVKWSYNLGWKGSIDSYFLEGTIDRFGNFYFALDTLYSFDFTGKIRWKLGLQGMSYGSLINDVDGTVYLNIGSISKYIAVSKEGNKIWEVSLGSQFSGHSAAISGFNRIILPTFKSTNVFSIK